MVLGSSLVTVHDYQLPMADFIPSSRIFQKSHSNDSHETYNGIAPHRAGLYKQDYLEHEQTFKCQNIDSSRKPYVVRCSSVERFNASKCEFSPSVGRFTASQGEFSPSLERFTSSQGEFSPSLEKFTASQCEFSPSLERFTSSQGEFSPSLERFTASQCEFSPSLPLSSESSPRTTQFVQYYNGCHQEQPTSNDDTRQTFAYLPHSYETSTGSPSWPKFSALCSSSFSTFPEEDSNSRSPKIASHTHGLSNSTEQYSNPLHHRSGTFIRGDLFQKNETPKHMRPFTSNYLGYSDSSDVTFNALSPTSTYPPSSKHRNDNTPDFTLRRTGSKTSEQPNEFSGKFSSKDTADFQQYYTNLHSNSRASSTTLSSQSYSDISRAKTRHSLQLAKSSSGDLVYQSKSSETKNGFQSAGPSNAASSSPNFYFSLPRRCSSDHFLRRTLSHEPRIQEIKPMPVRTPNQSEIESEYVTLDNRYVPQKFTRLSGVTEGVVCFHNPQFDVCLPPSANANPLQDNHSHHGVAKEDALNTRTANTSTHTDRSNETILKSTVISASRKQTSKQKISTGSVRTMAETIGSLFYSIKGTPNSFSCSGSPGYGASVSDTSTSGQDTSLTSFRRRSSADPQDYSQALSRSKSLSDLQNGAGKSDERNINYSDDEDGDDFGFLSYPISFMPSSTSAAMNKAKSPSPGNRIFTKRWRNKTTAVSAVSTSVAMWTPGSPGTYTWCSVSGRKVQLRPVNILNLTEAERLALQTVALLKLQSMNIGCPISVPKDAGELPRAKKSPLSLKRRAKSASASALDTMAKDGTSQGLAFGIPLLRCILNDAELDKRIAAASAGDSLSSTKMRTQSSDNFLMFGSGRKSSSSSQGSAENGSIITTHRLESLTVPSSKRTASSDSLSESESSHNTNSSLIDALSLSTSNPASSRSSSLAIDSGQLVTNGEAQVPYVVKSCFKHIETYGLQTLGIFRVGCSKKRVKQLREEFDCGREVKLMDEHNPHDVGALLKEFFRDLPEPLLTRELYLPFLHAERIKDEQKRHMAISLLISMLPVPNRDTLWALLRFLAVVSHHASDVIDTKGTIVAGNKMDSHNLATLFGPNILHRTKVASDKELMSESVERVEQSKEVIEVVKDMIDNYHELFEISASLRDDVLRLLVESNQETVNRILRHLANQKQIETDPESTCSVFEDSCNSPVLYHSTFSDVDLIVLARKQATTSHRPLRVTKSADDSLDSPISDLLDPHFPESQTLSPVTRDNLKTFPSSMTPVLHQQRLDSGHSYRSLVPVRNPNSEMPYEPTKPEAVLRSRLEKFNFERPYSEGFSRSLNIPRQLYHRQNSSSSISSGLPSPLTSYDGPDNGQCGQWNLPTQRISRASSPKQLYRCLSSSSTLIASSTTSNFNHSESGCENSTPIGSVEWEQERWKQWEKIAAQKKTVEAEQETLV